MYATERPNEPDNGVFSPSLALGLRVLGGNLGYRIDHVLSVHTGHRKK